MSAAKAISDHLRDWLVGNTGPWVSMAVYSSGNGYPTIPDNLFFSLPVKCSNGRIEIVSGLQLSSQTEAGIEKTVKELMDERGEALSFLESSGKKVNILIIIWGFLINLSKDYTFKALKIIFSIKIVQSSLFLFPFINCKHLHKSSSSLHLKSSTNQPCFLKASTINPESIFKLL